MGSVKKKAVSEDQLCEEGPGICAMMMTAVSLFVIILSLPLSLMFVVKVVQVKKIKYFFFGFVNFEKNHSGHLTLTCLLPKCLLKNGG